MSFPSQNEIANDILQYREKTTDMFYLLIRHQIQVAMIDHCLDITITYSDIRYPPNSENKQKIKKYNKDLGGYSTEYSLWWEAMYKIRKELVEAGYIVHYQHWRDDQVNIQFAKKYNEQELEYIENDKCYICMEKLEKTNLLTSIGCSIHLVHYHCKENWEKECLEKYKTINSDSPCRQCGVCKKK